MLPENVRERIYVVAAMNGGRISAQALAIIAMIHGMDKEDIVLFKKFCDENSIVVYDESDEAESEVYNEDESEELQDDDDYEFMDCLEVESTDNEVRAYVEPLEVPKKVEHIKELLLHVTGWMPMQNVRVIVYRFGLDGKGVHTMEETAREFGMTPHLVCRIEAELFKAKDAIRRQRERREFFVKASERDEEGST